MAMKKIACCSLILLLGITSVYSSPTVQFKGTIINLGDDSIEMKKRNKEITVYLTPSTKILFQGKEVGLQSVEVCQKAKAVYVIKGDRKELLTLDILRQSYCTR